MTSMETLDKLWAKGRDFLGTKYAIMGGAMTWVSESNLVAAISNGGGFGTLACGSMEPEMLRGEIKKVFEKTSNPFGVNLITMHPMLDALIDVCIESKVSHVVLAGGIPTGASIEKLKSAGIKVVAFAPALVLAKRLLKMGVDALVLEGMEAGGHIGPVSTSVLAQEILPHIKEIPVFIAGGIGRGEAMLSYLEMGASGCQMGTGFVCATESIAHPSFKKAFIKANARDALPTVQLDPRFPVIPVRALKNEGTQEFMDVQRQVVNQYEAGELEMSEAQLKIEHFWAGSLRRAVVEGDIEHGSLMAGQSVGMVKKELPAAEILKEMVDQACHALDQRS